MDEVENSVAGSINFKDRRKIKNIHRIKKHWITSKRLKTLTKEERHQVGRKYLDEVREFNKQKKAEILAKKVQEKTEQSVKFDEN
jgi:hypothetical protein